MLRILDRYLLRELMAPFWFALLLLTFALEIPPILEYGETLITEGASWDIVVRVLATLVPQSLGITIPMALLFGILFTLEPLGIANRGAGSVRREPWQLLRHVLLCFIATARRPTSVSCRCSRQQAVREIPSSVDDAG